jgi:transposase
MNKRGSSKKTTLKYLRFLEGLQCELDNTNTKTLNQLLFKYNVTTRWGTFLKQNKIIYKNSIGYYKWSDKIPASIKLINKFRNECLSYDANIATQSKMSFTDNSDKIKLDYYNEYEWHTISNAKKIYDKSESTIRSIVRSLRKNNSKEITFTKNDRGREIILLNAKYLDSIFKKNKINSQPTLVYQNKQNTNKQEIGLIRRFLKWIY